MKATGWIDESKNTFLETEGDAWFVRNKQAVSTRKLPDDDPLICEILDININAGTKILEVGCGDGTRLAWLKHNVNTDCYGIEPSPQAVEAACARMAIDHGFFQSRAICQSLAP